VSPPCAAGIGLRAPHYRDIVSARPALGFLEVHAENFFADGGPALAWLERFRALYPLSVHGVGLSLGSADPLDEPHLTRLASLVGRFEPMLVSEHLSWSSVSGLHANELLPLPHTREAIDHLVPRIQAVQERLGRELLVENVSCYTRLGEESMPEWEFVGEVARRSGCRLLLDVSNVWVNSVNHGFDPRRYIDSIDARLVGEYHLGGFARAPWGLVDTHGRPVAEEAWALFDHALHRIGRRPTLVEWDNDLPSMEVLVGLADRATRALAATTARATA